MPRSYKVIHGLGTWWLWLTLTGCSEGSVPTVCSGNEPTSIRGVVTFQGQPMAGGVIVFTPDPERAGHGPPLMAEIAADGSYAIVDSVERPLRPGTYRVALAPPPHWRFAQGAAPFPLSLTRPDLSGLLRDIRPGQVNLYSFAIELVPESH
ncbi:MAG: carboxypeptidase-like regulatory domain-containing protein [Gemmataceae bacterium]|nr:carboxypeptidase-like regulatory domain-containing protein [Gemmataceae bacterium]MDW8244750.1 hypothetical protein [Thermogemmata sp.]